MEVYKIFGAVYKYDPLDSVLFGFFLSFQMQKEQQYSECEKGRLHKKRKKWDPPTNSPGLGFYTKITFSINKSKNGLICYFNIETSFH